MAHSVPTPRSQQEQLLFETVNWPSLNSNYQQVMEQGAEPRLQLALSLTEEEYHHPECEAVKAQPVQRSFCFHHHQITDTAILLIHGWTACPFEMREFGEILYQQGYNVYGVRLAGHGTQVADFAKYGYLDWENSALKGLAITSLFGQKIVVIGESMGGALASILAVNYPDLVTKIILCAPCFQIADWKAEFTVFGFVRRFIPEVDFGVLSDWQKGYWYNKIPVSAVTELVKLARKVRKIGPDILAETLIIQALNDKMVNYRGAQRFFHSLTNLSEKEKLLMLFPEGHHNLTVDLNPNKTKVFQWATEFISRNPNMEIG